MSGREETLRANAWHLNQAATALAAVVPGDRFAAPPDRIVAIQQQLVDMRNGCMTAQLGEVQNTCCTACRGTGRDPMSDNLNWLPCTACQGTGTP